MLSVEVDWQARTARFVGDTFQYKDIIKTFGVAKWNASARCWDVSEITVTRAQIEELLPAAIIRDLSEVPSAVAAEAAALPGLPESFGVDEIIQQAARVVATAFPGLLYVRGVISSLKRRPDGTLYLMLTAENAPDLSVSGVIWKSDVAKIQAPLQDRGFTLEENLPVMLQVQVRLYDRRAALSLSVKGIVAEYSLAKLLARREETNQRLKKEGLFDRNRSTMLPFLPQRLGIITSQTGTVIHDFRKALDVARFGFELLWCHASVQGETAAEEMIAALQQLSAQGVDAILLFRGGGSAADLAVFNEYRLARAVCECPVPVFSAIGHQEDQSSVQDVSFHTEGVPQGLGRYFADIVLTLRDAVERNSASIARSVASVAMLWRERLTSMLQMSMQSASALLQRSKLDVNASSAQLVRDVRGVLRQLSGETREQVSLFSSSAIALLRDYRRRVFELPEQIERAGRSLLRQRSEGLESLHAMIAASAPEVQMRRGFAMVRSLERDRYITRGEQVLGGQELELVFFDAVRTVQVKK